MIRGKTHAIDDEIFFSQFFYGNTNKLINIPSESTII